MSTERQAADKLRLCLLRLLHRGRRRRAGAVHPLGANLDRVGIGQQRLDDAAR